MKRVWQLGSLAVLALLIVQPAMATLPALPLLAPAPIVSPARRPWIRWAIASIEWPATVIQGQYFLLPTRRVRTPPQQVLVDRLTRDQGIGNVVVEQPLPPVAPPTLQGFDGTWARRTTPFPAVSFPPFLPPFFPPPPFALPRFAQRIPRSPRSFHTSPRQREICDSATFIANPDRKERPNQRTPTSPPTGGPPTKRPARRQGQKTLPPNSNAH